jgi:integrase/recombinase XerD
MKIDVGIKEFMVEMEIRRFTKKTLVGYDYRTRQFAKFMKEEMQTEDMDEITASTLKLFTQWLTKKGMKGTSINGYLKVIKVFLQYCYEEEFITFNVKRQGVKWVREEKPMIRAFTVQDVRLLLQNCKGFDYMNIRDRTLITILVETGLRASELTGLKQSDIFDDYIIVKGKGQKTRSVPVTPIMKQTMMRYERAKEDYFSTRNVNTEDFYLLTKNGKELHTGDVTRIIKRRGKEIEGVRVSAHTMRHFFAQQSIKNGVSLYSLSRLLGHESVGITQIYLNSLQDADIVHMSKNNSILMNM